MTALYIILAYFVGTTLLSISTLSIVWEITRYINPESLVKLPEWSNVLAINMYLSLLIVAGILITYAIKTML